MQILTQCLLYRTLKQEVEATHLEVVNQLKITVTYTHRCVVNI
jgi:hypothetical protein